MSVKIVIKPNTYFDSVSLMSISTRANKLDGVEQAFVAMATEMNKGVLGNDSNLLIVFYVQIMPDDFVMQLHRF